MLYKKRIQENKIKEDVRILENINDLATFGRFVALISGC